MPPLAASAGVNCAADQLGEFVGAFDWREVSDAIDRVQLSVAEELIESVRPLTRK